MRTPDPAQTQTVGHAPEDRFAPVLNRLRQLKHTIYLPLNRWRWALHHKLIWHPQNVLYPRIYRKQLRTEDFPVASPYRAVTVASHGGSEATPRRIFTLWTGDNELTPNRARCLDDLHRIQQGLDVVLVSPAILDEWVLPEHPLHPAYLDLSLVHRSDYLRCYLLYHHGGGYADLKQPLTNWTGVFDDLDADRRLHGAGFPEIGVQSVGGVDPITARLLQHHYAQLLATQSFIFKPRSQMVATWLAAVEAILDAKAEALHEEPGDIWGRQPGYPSHGPRFWSASSIRSTRYMRRTCCKTRA